MSMLKFEARIIEINSWKVILIPKNISSQYPSRGMVMASGMINDYSIILPLEPDGKGSHWFSLEDKIVKALDLKVGDIVNVDLTSINQWIEPQVPIDIIERLKEDKLIEEWIDLTIKARWDWLRWIQSTKSPNTRTKRIDVMMSKLSKGDRRPCCFNRNICTITEVSQSGVLLNEEVQH